MAATVVPNRKLILLAVAAGYAASRGAGAVAYAAHAGDHAIYPDCRPEFVAAAENAILAGCGVELLAPFLTMTKAEIVKTGAVCGFPFEFTWSCYKGLEIHCGKCGTCVERREAFELAGVPDPTIYDVSTHEVV
jgi:7-cyano-7-deazaguanine synthase